MGQTREEAPLAHPLPGRKSCFCLSPLGLVIETQFTGTLVFPLRENWAAPVGGEGAEV